MKFLSRFMVLFLLSGCSFLSNQPEYLTRDDFPTEWQGYYKLESNSSTLYYLTKEFKISRDYLTFKNEGSSSYYFEEEFTSYQIDSIYKSDDFCFTVYPAYESQGFIEGYFLFQEQADDTIKVYYYYDTYKGSKYDLAYYKKSDTPFE